MAGALAEPRAYPAFGVLAMDWKADYRYRTDRSIVADALREIREAGEKRARIDRYTRQALERAGYAMDKHAEDGWQTGPDAKRMILRRAESLCDWMLELHWGAVERVKHALLKHGELTAKQVALVPERDPYWYG